MHCLEYFGVEFTSWFLQEPTIFEVSRIQSRLSTYPCLCIAKICMESLPNKLADFTVIAYLNIVWIIILCKLSLKLMWKFIKLLEKYLKLQTFLLCIKVTKLINFEAVKAKY